MAAKAKSPHKSAAKSTAIKNSPKGPGHAKRLPKETNSLAAKPDDTRTVDAEIVDSLPIVDENPSQISDEDAYATDIELTPDQEFDAKLEKEIEKATALGSSSVGKSTASRSGSSGIISGPSSERALTTVDPVKTYLAEIRKYPLLTKEEEHELAVRYREQGDAQAAEKLVTSNLRFVVKVAAEYSRFGARLIDLVQEGNVGLMHAVREYNPYKDVRLITYAVWWIRGYIQEYLMRQYSMVRIGTTQSQRKLFYRLQKEREALNSLGHQPTTALLAGRLGVSEEDVKTMSQRMSGRDVSLNTPIDGENSTASLLDFEAAPDAAIDDVMAHDEEVSLLKKNIEKIKPQLSEKEIYILENRLLSDEPQTLQEIGDHYHVTREAVRQLEVRLMGKIRTSVTQALGESESD